MNSYRFDIGEYYSDTCHLNPLQDIVYRRMMDRYFLTESPLPDSVERIAHLIRMPDHQLLVISILKQFFTLEDGSYIHSRFSQRLKKIAGNYP